MTDRRQEDWISAYLDDELSPEEFEQAQLWLENDAELRDYVEKLKGVGERIRTLPAHRLPSAFAAQIREKVGAMTSDENLDSKGRLAHAKTPVSLARQDDRSGLNSSSRGKYLAFGLTGTLAATLLLAVVLLPQLVPQFDRSLAESASSPAFDSLGGNAEGMAAYESSMADVETDSFQEKPKLGSAQSFDQNDRESVAGQEPSRPTPAGVAARASRSDEMRMQSGQGNSLGVEAGPRGGGFGAGLNAVAEDADIEGGSQTLAQPTRKMSANDREASRFFGSINRSQQNGGEALLYQGEQVDAHTEWFATLSMESDATFDEFLESLALQNFEFSSSESVAPAVRAEIESNAGTPAEAGLGDFQRKSKSLLEQAGVLLLAIEGTPQELQVLLGQVSAADELKLYRQVWHEVQPMAAAIGQEETPDSVETEDPRTLPRPIEDPDSSANEPPSRDDEISNEETTEVEATRRAGQVRIVHASEWPFRMIEKARLGRSQKAGSQVGSSQADPDNQPSGLAGAGTGGPDGEQEIGPRISSGGVEGPVAEELVGRNDSSLVPNATTEQMKLYLVIVSDQRGENPSPSDQN